MHKSGPTANLMVLFLNNENFQTQYYKDIANKLYKIHTGIKML